MLSKIALDGRHKSRSTSGRGILTGVPFLSTTADTELSDEFTGFPILRAGETTGTSKVDFNHPFDEPGNTAAGLKLLKLAYRRGSLSSLR